MEYALKDSPSESIRTVLRQLTLNPDALLKTFAERGHRDGGLTSL
jgi:hypothetical protein